MSKRFFYMVFFMILIFLSTTGLFCGVRQETDLGVNEDGQKVREVKKWRHESDEASGSEPDRTFLEIWDPVTKEWYEGEWHDPKDHSKGLRLIGPEQVRRKSNLKKMNRSVEGGRH